MINKKGIEEEQDIINHLVKKYGQVPKEALPGMFDYFKYKETAEPSQLLVLPLEGYVKEAASVISNLLKKVEKCLVITFDYRTRDLAYELEKKGVDLHEKVYFIDAISYNQGKGTPPVYNVISTNRPHDFENIFYYSIIQFNAMKEKSRCIVIIAPYNLLDFTDYNEAGVFLRWFRDRMAKLKTPLIYLYQENKDPIFKRIIQDLL